MGKVPLLAVLLDTEILNMNLYSLILYTTQKKSRPKHVEEIKMTENNRNIFI